MGFDAFGLYIFCIFKISEPDFPYLEALAPFQPLAMKVSTVYTRV